MQQTKVTGIVWISFGKNVNRIKVLMVLLKCVKA